MNRRENGTRDGIAIADTAGTEHVGRESTGEAGHLNRVRGATYCWRGTAIPAQLEMVLTGAAPGSVQKLSGERDRVEAARVQGLGREIRALHTVKDGGVIAAAEVAADFRERVPANAMHHEHRDLTSPNDGRRARLTFKLV
jgi:hypothetical protein